MVAILYCFINNEVREILFVPICLISIHCRKRKLKMVLNCYIFLVQEVFFLTAPWDNSSGKCVWKEFRQYHLGSLLVDVKSHK